MPRDAVFLNRITFGLVSLMAEIGVPHNTYRVANAYFARHDPDWPEDPRLRLRLEARLQTPSPDRGPATA